MNAAGTQPPGDRADDVALRVRIPAHLTLAPRLAAGHRLLFDRTGPQCGPQRQHARQGRRRHHLLKLGHRRATRIALYVSRFFAMAMVGYGAFTGAWLLVGLGAMLFALSSWEARASALGSEELFLQALAQSGQDRGHHADNQTEEIFIDRDGHRTRVITRLR